MPISPNRLRPLWALLILLLTLGACSAPPTTPAPGDATPSAAALPTDTTMPPPAVHTTSVPDARTAARAYLDAWRSDNYAAMHALLTPLSQDAMNLEEFTKHYQGVAAEAALSGVDYEILSSLVDMELAQVNYRVTLHSVLVGDVTRDTVMHLALDRGQWRVQWDDTLVLPELTGGNYLAMDRQGYVPTRANIYDRNEQALVAMTDATAIGLYPDNIVEDQAELLFSELTRLTGLRSDAIQAMYANFPFGSGWYLPLGEISTDRIGRRWDVLSGLSGLVLSSYKSRYYFDSGVAPHVVGYVSAIQAEEVETYKRRGYLQDERVGRAGLEYWGEKYLAGKRGGALYVFSAQGQPVTRLAEAPAEPSQAIYTTLDKDFQEAAQRAISGFKGAIVAVERDTGRVVGLVSSPGFDPNAFEPINFNSYSLLSEISSDPAQPLYNRATQGQYPLGSVFKIVTMAAALESGNYTPESTLMCGYAFEELPSTPLYDWTWEHFQNDGRTQPSGELTLSQGLMRSCNPWFYHIGLDFFNRGDTKAIADMSRGFGLGSKTGIEGVVEEAGNIPEPASSLDATNLAIGQGEMQVTPLQVASFVAAVGNGGTLYRPQVIERIAPPDGEPTFEFKPEVRGELPVKQSTLKAIQEAMVGVVSSTKPYGTAQHVFLGLNIPVAGKTGTATSGQGMPHAWFAGYSFAEKPNKPDIAIAVIVENIGEGSDYAAPIFRRLMELYFRGSPGRLYPWESTYYVTRTPTLNVTLTPTPEAFYDANGNLVDADGNLLPDDFPTPETRP
jgi:penicillin-binding protein 2